MDKSGGSPGRRLKVALIGQPNVGKSTIFDLLTGMSQRVDHWPGTSIERRIGTVRYDGTVLTVTELPSLYSLSDSCRDEQIICTYLLDERPDVIVYVADAAALEHSLYLLAEVIWLPTRVVLALNMMDVAKRLGLDVHVARLQEALGVAVVPMSAAAGGGKAALLAAIVSTADADTYAPTRPGVRDDHRPLLETIRGLIAGKTPPAYPIDLAALKLLEGDEHITAVMQQNLGPDWDGVAAMLAQHDDSAIAVASSRYEWIAWLLRTAVRRVRPDQVTVTDRIDRLATHPLLGILVLLGVLATLFWLIYSIGTPLQNLLHVYVVEAVCEQTRQAMIGFHPFLVGLITDGIFAGAGTVLTLLPILIIFFTLLGILDDCGYIARAAYVVDRFMHLMGLHGNSFLPLFLGFGCNVPAVLGSRIIPSAHARLLTILITPLVPCGARLAVLAILTPIFFGGMAFLVTVGLIIGNLVVLIVVGVLLHEVVLGGEHVAFIMELPLYHVPSWRTVALSVWRQTVSFVKEAGSVIVVVAVVMWAFSTFPNGRIETSYLAAVGRLLAPVGALMGLSWQMMVALVTSFVRKENTIATLTVLYGAGHGDISWMAALSHALTPASGLAFLVTQLLFIPCVATVVAIRQETQSWRWTLINVVMLLAVSFWAGIATYHLAHFLGM